MINGENSWTAFRTELDRLDWDHIEHDDAHAPLDTALARIAENPDAIAFRVHELLSDENLFNDSLRDTAYPKQFFDEFLIYRDPHERYRVRLHRFKTVEQNGSLVEPIHDHKWFGMSVLLSGPYLEHRFRFADQHLEQVSERAFTPGMRNALVADTIHAVSVPYAQPSLTLFVRGPVRRPNFRLYERSGDGWSAREYPPHAQNVRDALSEIGRLNAAFPLV